LIVATYQNGTKRRVGAIRSARTPQAAEPAPPASPIEELEDAELAYKRVEPEALALGAGELTALNVDVVSATSIILGVARRVLGYRARMAMLPEFDIRDVDALVDRAKAALFATVTNLPPPEPKELEALLLECRTLRRHLLSWAGPLAEMQKFDRAALAQIKRGSGKKDVASDVVALVSLYRSKWDEVRTMCGVTEADLDRGAVLGTAVFAKVSRRENERSLSQSEGMLRVRRFWTLADRSYAQCRRAIAFLACGVADVDSIAPNLRRNSGKRASSRSAAPVPSSILPSDSTPTTAASGNPVETVDRSLSPEANPPPSPTSRTGSANPAAGDT
jgi:hypothetical protein